MTNFESVKKFMHTFGQEVRAKAGFPNDKIIGLRLDLIREELSELKETQVALYLRRASIHDQHTNHIASTTLQNHKQQLVDSHNKHMIMKEQNS